MRFINDLMAFINQILICLILSSMAFIIVAFIVELIAYMNNHSNCCTLDMYKYMIDASSCNLTLNLDEYNICRYFHKSGKCII